MSLLIQNNKYNISAKYTNNSLQKTTMAFSNVLNEANKYSNASSTTGIKYGEDLESVLIEDKKFYDFYGFPDIEFGSNEWDKWKDEHTKNFFPSLDAPVQVRQAWREVRESIPEDDEEALYEFTARNMFLACSFYYKDQFFMGVPRDFQLNTPKDYEKLLDIDISRNKFFSEICSPSDKGLYIKAIKLDEKIRNQLHKVLFGI